MRRRHLIKLITVFAILLLVFSIAGCSNDAQPESDDPGGVRDDTPSGSDETPGSTDKVPGTNLSLQGDLKVIHASDADGFYSYVTDKPLDDIFVYYNNMPIFEARLEFEAVPDIFFLQTELYELLFSIDIDYTDPEAIDAFEQKLIDAYEATGGVMVVLGIRGGATQYYDMVPEEVRGEIPDEGSLIHFGIMIDKPGS